MALIALLLQRGAAHAASTVRRLFEPTDLEFEEPGTSEADLQFGLVRGQDSYRVSMPDFELDLGLMKNVELDLDGEFALGGPDTGELRIDQLAQDNLWSALKIGLGTWERKEEGRTWALGAQVGPVWPLAPGAQGVGVAGLALLGLRVNQSFFALNLGAQMQPGDDPHQPKQQAVVAGVDMELALDADGIWALTGEVGGAAYWSPDPSQLTTALGIQWAVRDDLELMLTGFRGWLSGGDQFGVLVGLSPKFRLW